MMPGRGVSNGKFLVKNVREESILFFFNSNFFLLNLIRHTSKHKVHTTHKDIFTKIGTVIALNLQKVLLPRHFILIFKYTMIV